MSNTELVQQDVKDGARHLQDFRNMRIILLDTIWELLIDAQLKTSDGVDKQALSSLRMCKDSLEKCLQSLEANESDVSYLDPSLETYKHDNAILDIYFVQLGNVIKHYIKDNAIKQTLEAMLVENIGIMQLGIQMLELLTGTDNNLLMKLKEKVFPHTPQENPQADSLPEQSGSVLESEATRDTLQDNGEVNERSSQESVCSRLSGGRKTFIKVGRESLTSRDFVRNIKRFRTEVRRHSHKSPLLREAIKSFESPSPKLSYFALKIQANTLKDAAAYVIDSLFSLKAHPRALTKCDVYMTGLRVFDVGLANLWLALCGLHNKLLSNSMLTKLDDIKETLTKFYLTKMQILLQQNITRSGLAYRRVSRRPTLSMSPSMKALATQNSPESRVMAMHKQLYTMQMKKLRESRKKFNSRRLYNLLINLELPETPSEHEIMRQYETDPEHYNVLIMTINRDSQRETLLQIIERNFGEIKILLNRAKRREQMFKSASRTTLKQQVSTINTNITKINLHTEHPLILDEPFFQMERAKWAKFFAEQELTPTEQKLDNIRQKRQHDLDRQHRLEQKQKALEERVHRRTIRPIVSLYTTPRVTHRMRRAMEQISEDVSVEFSSIISKKKARQTIDKANAFRKEHPLAAAMLDSQSWTSCCSECRRFQYVTPPNSALDRFLRTQEEFMALENYCDHKSNQLTLSK